MLRRLVPATLLFAALAPPMAHAQVNIDQDKTPAHIFTSDCAVCHKSARGLANGRGNSALTSFLAEHYTSSREEAAAMAGYVLASGGGVGTAPPARAQNAEGGRERASAEGPKSRDARRPAKPEEEPTASAKPKRTPAEHGKPVPEERSATVAPGRPAPARTSEGEPHGMTAATHRQGVQKPSETPQPAASEPATVAAERKPEEAPKPELSPLAPAASAAVSPAQPNEAAPKPTDNIPD